MVCENLHALFRGKIEQAERHVLVALFEEMDEVCLFDLGDAACQGKPARSDESKQLGHREFVVDAEPSLDSLIELIKTGPR